MSRAPIAKSHLRSCDSCSPPAPLTAAGMASQETRLSVLLRQHRWHSYSVFRSQYDKVAREIDSDLVGTWPSRAQFQRWLKGDLKGLPYPDHCMILERMLPGWTAEQLFAHIEDGERIEGSGGSAPRSEEHTSE